VATLNQPQYRPFPVEEQVAVIWSATNGYLDQLPVADVPRFNADLLDFLRAEGGVLKTIRESGDLADDTVAALRTQVETYAQSFQTEAEPAIAAG
jgi:F-type H+/Na+-transporting ATPase subunit alpha